MRIGNLKALAFSVALLVGLAHGALAQSVGGGGGGSGGTVTVGSALPAGSNTIGTVNLGTVPSLTIGSSALPAGAATAASQTNVQSAPGTTQSTAVTIQGNASGIAVPVSGTILASQSGTWNIGTITTLPNITIGAALPAGSNSIGTVVLGAGSASVGTVTVGSSALPTGAATSALQSTANTSLASLVAGNAGTPTQTTGTCGTSSGTVLAASSATNFEIFSNPSTSGQTVWLNFAGAAATTAAPSKDLLPGQQISWTAQGNGYLPTAAVTCIASSSTSITVLYK